MTAKTLRLPAHLAEWLRTAAFERRTSQTAIIVEALERLRNGSDVDGPTFDHVR